MNCTNGVTLKKLYIDRNSEYNGYNKVMPTQHFSMQVGRGRRLQNQITILVQGNDNTIRESKKILKETEFLQEAGRIKQ